MSRSWKVTGDLKYFQAKLCFQSNCLHGLSIPIFTAKFVFHMYLTCLKIDSFQRGK